MYPGAIDYMQTKIILSAFALPLMVMSAGCGLQEPRWQTYEEVYLKPAAAKSPSQSATSQPPHEHTEQKPLRWTKPEGWNELAGSGMRIATFTTTSGEHSATCTVISLSGAAGGLEANVVRWIGQLKLAKPSPEELTSLLDRQHRYQSQGGLDGVLIDLTELGPAADNSSMLASLVPYQGATLFIKMTGPIELLAAEKDRFSSLCTSLRSEP